MRRLIVLFGCLVAGASADIYTFSAVPIPGNHTLASYYLFHIYATEVGPKVDPTATVTFKNFEINWPDKAGTFRYESLQVSLIPWSNFWRLIHKDSFCRGSQLSFASPTQGIPLYNLASKEEATFQIKQTDAYLLTVTNCGDRDGPATIMKGDVIVKQQHGLLPGNKIATFNWLGWFTLVKAFICIMWVIALSRHYKSLVYVQKVIGACAVMAFLEAATSYLQYRAWNVSGTRSFLLTSVSMFFYSMKYVLTLRMLIETAAGSGITVQRLEVGVEVKMDLVCTLFLVMQFLWKMILSYRYSHMLGSTSLVVITIPGTLFWFVLFIWVYRKFRALSELMHEKNLASEAVSLFINTRLVLLLSILLATVVLVVQFADIVMAATPWELHWVPYDAAPHSVYTLFLLAFMILWWPHAESWKIGYSDQVNQVEDAAGEDGKDPAEQIGVAKAEEM